MVEVVSSARRVDHNCSNITHCCATHCHIPFFGKMSGNIRARSFRMSVFVNENSGFLSPLRSVRRRLHGFEAMVKLNDYHKPTLSFINLIC